MVYVQADIKCLHKSHKGAKEARLFKFSKLDGTTNTFTRDNKQESLLQQFNPSNANNHPKCFCMQITLAKTNFY